MRFLTLKNLFLHLQMKEMENISAFIQQYTIYYDDE